MISQNKILNVYSNFLFQLLVCVSNSIKIYIEGQPVFEIVYFDQPHYLHTLMAQETP